MTQVVNLIHNLQTIAEEMRRDGKGLILLMVAAGWFLSIGIRFMYPPLLPFFRAEFGFGLSTAGTLLSLLWVAYAFGQFPGGVLGDQIGEGNTLVISTVLSIGAILIVIFSVNAWMLFIGTIIFGLATALYGPTRFTIFTDVYDNRAGTAVGFSHAFGSLGNTILPAMAVGIASYTSWRLGYGVLVPALVGITIGLWLWVPSHTSSNKQSNNKKLTSLMHQISLCVFDRGISVIIVIQVILTFVSQGFLGFYPVYLIEIKGFSPTVASVLFSLYFAVGVFIQILAGLSNDRFGERRTLTILCGLYFLGLFALYFAQTFLHILFLTVLLSHRNGTGVITNTFLADAIFDDIKGMGLGFLRTGWILIGAISPIFVGYLGDLQLLNQAFIILSLLTGLATLLTVFIPYNRNRND